MTAIILVNPQMGENIGASARAMFNFGYTDLRLVSPRDGWPNPKAIEMAAGAKMLIENAQIFDSVEDAIADLQYIYATTARNRDLDKRVLSLSEISETPRNPKSGILFGAERSGLSNEEIALADKIISIPVGEIYQSLNLAMSVGIVCYEFSKTPKTKNAEHRELATKSELDSLFKHLDETLTARDFFQVDEKKAGMMRNIKTMLTRAEFSAQEVRTLRGIIRALAQD